MIWGGDWYERNKGEFVENDTRETDFNVCRKQPTKQNEVYR